MGGTVWTEPVDARLRELFDAGMVYSAIAATLSAEFKEPISRNAAIGRASRIGLTGRKSGFQPINETNRAKRIRAKPVSRVVRVVRPQSYGLQILETTQRVDAPAAAVADVLPLHVSLLDLEPGACRYPYGTGPFTFCGCPAVAGLPYCRPHQTLCGGEPMSVRERRSAAQKARWAKVTGFKRFTVVAA